MSPSVNASIALRSLTPDEAARQVGALSAVLIDCVEGGASVGSSISGSSGICAIGCGVTTLTCGSSVRGVGSGWEMKVAVSGTSATASRICGANVTAT